MIRTKKRRKDLKPKGRRQNRKSRKFGTMSQLGLTPPPPPTFGTFLNFRHFWKMLTPPFLPNWDIFEFQTFLKNADPSPLWPNWDIFEFQTFFIKAKMQNNYKIINMGHYWKIAIPPLCFQNSQVEIGTFLFFGPLPPLLEHCPKYSRFSISNSPKRMTYL